MLAADEDNTVRCTVYVAGYPGRRPRLLVPVVVVVVVEAAAEDGTVAYATRRAPIVGIAGTGGRRPRRPGVVDMGGIFGQELALSSESSEHSSRREQSRAL